MWEMDEILKREENNILNLRQLDTDITDMSITK